jgi:hypothetical protein
VTAAKVTTVDDPLVVGGTNGCVVAVVVAVGCPNGNGDAGTIVVVELLAAVVLLVVAAEVEVRPPWHPAKSATPRATQTMAALVERRVERRSEWLRTSLIFRFLTFPACPAKR